MVVRHLSASLGLREDFLQGPPDIGDRANPHGGAIAPALVRLTTTATGPEEEGSAVDSIRVGVEPVVKGVHVVASVQKTVGDGDREYRIIRERALGSQQREYLGLSARVFVDRPNHVTCNRTEHA
jgi:hypothetical protein